MSLCCFAYILEFLGFFIDLVPVKDALNSGSGKSTIARTIAKMIPGTIVVQSGAFHEGVMAQWGFDEYGKLVLVLG